MLVLLPFPASPPERPGKLALRLSKDQISDAFGLNSTKSRETAGVVVLVLFPKATRRLTATRTKKNYPLDKQNDNFALVSRFLYIFFFFFFQLRYSPLTFNSGETHQHLTNERHGIKAIKF